jgi:hypothetical protein
MHTNPFLSRTQLSFKSGHARRRDPAARLFLFTFVIEDARAKYKQASLGLSLIFISCYMF